MQRSIFRIIKESLSNEINSHRIEVKRNDIWDNKIVNCNNTKEYY